jgi:hypothetical protein
MAAVLERVLSDSSSAAKDAFEIYFRPLLAIPAQFHRMRTGDSAFREHAEAMRNVEIGLNTRLAELRDWAQSEQASISPDSESDLRNFLKAASVTQSPAVYLLENGNFRTVWKGDGDEHVGLQFLGGRQVQFVLFSPRYDPEIVSRSSGRDTARGILDQIRALKLHGVLDGKR